MDTLNARDSSKELTNLIVSCALPTRIPPASFLPERSARMTCHNQQVHKQTLHMFASKIPPCLHFHHHLSLYCDLKSTLFHGLYCTARKVQTWVSDLRCGFGERIWWYHTSKPKWDSFFKSHSKEMTESIKRSHNTYGWGYFDFCTRHIRNMDLTGPTWILHSARENFCSARATRYQRQKQ